MIDKAIKLGLKTLCFTDHMDYDYPKIYDYSFQFDIDNYLKKLQILKEKYKSQIEILIGLELGMQPHISDSMYKLINSFPFDFIIGSIHIVNQMDPYYPQYWENITEEEGIVKCFEEIQKCCEIYQGFHVCGHID